MPLKMGAICALAYTRGASAGGALASALGPATVSTAALAAGAPSPASLVAV
jgi:hypothetical protein